MRLRVGNTTRHSLKTRMEPRLPGMIGLLMKGSRLVEVVWIPSSPRQAAFRKGALGLFLDRLCPPTA